jgi:hypothetical protein
VSAPVLPQSVSRPVSWMGLTPLPTNGSSGNSVILLEYIVLVKRLAAWVGVDDLQTLIDLVGK